MAAGRKSMQLVESGNFSAGIVTDAVGANNSLLDLLDGMIDRNGEIRKRGGRATYDTIAEATIANTYLAAGYNSETGYLFSKRGEPSAFRTKFIIGGQEYFEDGTFGTNRVGSGFITTNYGPNIIISSAGGSNPNDRIGVWGGAVDANKTTVTNTASTTNGSREVTHTVAGTFSSLSVGQWVSFAGGTLTTGTRYRVTEIYDAGPGPGSGLRVDRGLDDTVAVLATVRREGSIRPIANPNNIEELHTGTIVETHQDRLFVAGFKDFPNRIRWSGTPNDADSGKTANHSAFDYFEEAAWIEVSPGVGGKIVGLASWQNNLLVIKEDGLFLLRGDFSTKGFDFGLSQDLISDNTGCFGLTSYTKARDGVYIANHEGLWRFSGQNLQAVTDGRAQTLWSSVITGAGRMSSVNDRVIIRHDLNRYFVWNASDGYFSRVSGDTGSEIIDAIDDGELQLIKDGGNNRIIDWSGDKSTDLADDAWNPDTPRLEVLTAALPATGNTFFEGRANNVYITGLSDGSDLSVSLIYGRDLQESAYSGFRSIDSITSQPSLPLEYGFDSATEDDSQRIPVDGAPDRPPAAVFIKQEGSADDVRIYGIGIEFFTDYVVDRDA